MTFIRPRAIKVEWFLSARGAACVAAAFCLIVSAGCGGGGSGSGMTAQTQTGGLRFAIVWPNAQPSATLPKKLIPFNTQTIVVAVEDPQTEMSLATPVIINRSSNPREEVTIQGIRPGSVRVIAAAFATSPPSGDPLAVGEANTSVSTGQTTDVNVTLFAFAPPPPPLT